MQRLRSRLLAVLLLAGVACGPATATPGRGSRDRITGTDPDERNGGSGVEEGVPDGDGPTGTDPAPDFEDPALDAFIKTQMESTHTPGLSAVIIKGGKVRFAKGYGLADVSKSTPVTVDTLFMLASISKTVTAAAVMKLVESGAVGLDDDVGTAAGFPIRNPAFADAKITYRHLLTHTSTIANGTADRQVNGDSPIPLAGYVQGFVTQGGQYFAAENFSAWAPGAKWDYSNNGFATLGYLVQAKSGSPFEDYCKKSIFDPLRMKETSWRLSGVDVSHVAIPHEWSGGRYSQIAHFGYPDWPAGQLRTSAMQFARFMRMIMGKGELDGVRVLASETVAEMLKPQTKSSYGDDQMLAWYDTPYKTRHILGHSGSGPGVSTIMGFDPKDGAGVILLSNGSVYFSSEADARGFEAIFLRLIDTSEKISATR